MQLTSESLGNFKGYAIAVGVSTAAVLLQDVLHLRVDDRFAFLFALSAVVIVVFSLGRGPGFVVMWIAAANEMFYPASPVQWNVQLGQNAAAWFVYFAVGTSIIVYGGRLKLTTARAALAERRLSMAQEGTGVGVFELDFESGKAFVTPTLCQMLGQPTMNGPIELDRWLGALNPDHVRESRRVLQASVDRGELRYEREQRIELPDGGVRWLLNRVSIDLTGDGKPGQAKGAAVDITERKQLDESLQEAQAELRQQVHDLQRLHVFAQRVTSEDDPQAPMPALIDLVVEMHGAEHGLLWLVDEDCAGFQLVAQKGFVEGGALHLIPKVVSTPSMQVERGQHSSELGQIQCDEALSAHRAAAKECGFGTVLGIPLRASSGGVIGFISILFEEPHEPGKREMRLGEVVAVTAAALVERDRARTAAFVNERRFAVALESSLVPFTILAPVRDKSGCVVDFEWSYLNRSAAQVLRVDARACVGMPVSQFLPETWKSSDIFSHYVGVVDRGESCDFETRSIATEGGWLHVTASPLQGSAAVWFADITQQKQQQQDLLNADRRKDEFLAVLAHELRNPLAPIRQAILVARSASSSADQKQWGFGVVERQVRNMGRLLDDLLDVSRITRGTLELKKSRVQLFEIVDAALEASRPSIDAKQHGLTIEIPRTGCTLNVDALRMSQVIGNLLTNAAKYTDAGGDIRLTAQVGPSGLSIRIADNGVGLTPDQFDRLFEMFSQMPASAGRSQGGLGIGLALSRHILELHGGQITVSSPGPGQGSEFVVLLPTTTFPDGSADAARTSASSCLALQEHIQPRRVIVADDNVDAAESLAEMLRLDGHDVHVCFDGAQALSEFRRIQPEVALLDVGMPLLSGLEVSRAIRSSRSGPQAILVAVTGWGQARDQELAFGAGFDYHMTKPVQPEQLRAIVAGQFHVGVNKLGPHVAAGTS